jgi:hypothetical protein
LYKYIISASVFYTQTIPTMNTKNYKISIDSPCTEQWDGMTVNEMGKFCGKCQKTVVDFTAFSDEDIIAYFTINKDKETCGRFYKKQLDRVIIPIDTYTFSFRMTARQRLLVLFLLFFGYDLYQVELVFGQNSPPDSIITNQIDTQKNTLSSVNDTLIKTEIAADVVEKDTAPNYVWQNGDTNTLEVVMPKYTTYTTIVAISGMITCKYMPVIPLMMEVPQSHDLIDESTLFYLLGEQNEESENFIKADEPSPKPLKKDKKTPQKPKNVALRPENIVLQRKKNDML